MTHMAHEERIANAGTVEHEREGNRSEDEIQSGRN